VRALRGDADEYQRHMREFTESSGIAGMDLPGTSGPRRRHGPRWVVDGMNVFGSRPDRWWNDPDRAVRRFVEELERYASATGDEVTVVFDRHPRDVQPGMHGTIRVAFASRRGPNAADHEIVRMVGEDPEPGSLTVVTSDASLAERVKQLGARVKSAGSFRRSLDETPR
jgi:predicted RNA-binding protein with PIN domain